MSEIKVEKRGKYGGVKVHLDGPQCQALLNYILAAPESKEVGVAVAILMETALAIKKLLKKEPDLLKDRTPEEIAAILLKEKEAAELKLERMKNGKEWSKLNPEVLRKELLKHVEK